MEKKLIKDILTESTKEIQHVLPAMIIKPYSQLHRQLSTPSSSSMIPPPFPTIKHQHDFEEFIFSSGYVCCHCGGSFKSSKFLFSCNILILN